jgi:hypothetical protein
MTAVYALIAARLICASDGGRAPYQMSIPEETSPLKQKLSPAVDMPHR